MIEVMFFFGIILIISIWSTRLSNRWSVPVLLVFIAIGMVAKLNGFHVIEMENRGVEYAIGSITMAFILFFGGLETHIREVKNYYREGALLSTVGVVFTMVLFAIPLHYFLNISWALSLLIGATAASTDAAAVFSVLKSSQGIVKKKLASVLELESGSNDPIAYVLVLIFIQVLQSPENLSWSHYIIFFVLQIILGGAVGIIVGLYPALLTTKRFSKLKINVPELYVVLVLGLVMITYAGAEMIGGNPFLSVYILGIIIGSRKLLYRKSTIRFFSVIAWIMQIILFVSLGLLISPMQLMEHWVSRILLVLFLMFLIRPAMIFTLMQFFGKRYNFREKIFLSWGGLKGAVPIVFATLIYSKGVKESDMIFNLIFFIVLFSVLIQGSTLSWLGRKLYVIERKKKVYKEHIAIEEVEYFEEHLMECEILPEMNFHQHSIRELTFPVNVLIVSVIRNGEYLYPKASLKLEIGDRLLISAENKSELLSIIREKQRAFGLIE